MARALSKTFAFSVEGVISNTGFYDPGRVYQGMKGLQRTDPKTSWIIGFDSSNRQICCERISMRKIMEDIIVFREVSKKLTYILKKLIIIGVSTFIYVHKEHTKCMKPEDDDIYLTNKLSRIAYILGLKFQDHIIVGDNGYYSFVAHNLLLEKFYVDRMIEGAVEHLIFLREQDDPKKYEELIGKIYWMAALLKWKIIERRPQLYIVPRKQS